MDATELKTRLGPDGQAMLIVPHLEEIKWQSVNRKGKAQCLQADRHTNNDAKPSMEINFPPPEGRRILWCPVCDQGWDLFDALQHIHKCDFRQAREIAVEAAGVTKPEAHKSPPKKSKGFVAANPEQIGAKVAAIIPGDASYVAVYTYTPTFMVVRVETTDGTKTFRPVHQVDNRWFFGDPSGPLPLYHLDEVKKRVTAGWPTWVAEGEKCANALLDVGLTGTTSAHGAKSPARTDWTPLAGAEVVICQDNDDPGIAYGQAVTEILLGLDPPAKVRRLSFDHLEPGQDVADDIAAALVKYADDEQGPGRAAQDDLQARADAQGQEGPTWRTKPEIRFMDEMGEYLDPGWLWDGYVACGAITVLAGYPKAGKTTLVAHLLSQMVNGGELAGHEVTPGRAVVLSEEGENLWRMRNATMDFGHRWHRLHPATPFPDTAHELEDFIRVFCRAAVHRDITLAVIDTLVHFSVAESENDAAQMHRAVVAWRPLTEAGMAVLLIHHTRKSAAGDAIQTIRGSSAIVGAADITVVLTKDKDDNNARILDATGSRYSAPDTVLMCLGEGGYEVVGEGDSVKDVKRNAMADRVLVAMPPDQWLTVEDVRMRVATDARKAVSASTVERALRALAKSNRIEKKAVAREDGQGKMNQYRRSSLSDERK